MKALFILWLNVVMALLSQAEACTATRVHARDGTLVYARTLELAKNLHSNVLFIPRHYSLKGTSPFEGRGLKWTTKYAVVGTNAENKKIIVDGVNETGLAAGMFYFPTYAKYQAVTRSEADSSISSIDFAVWALTNFQSIEEVKQALSGIKVSNAPFKEWGFTVPLHYMITEPRGKSLVVEYVKGKLHLYDNHSGTFTNAPQFNWHITNLRNYLNLSTSDVPEIEINGHRLKQFGAGSGMHGLPGDFTPPSRFVRAAIFTNTQPKTDTGGQAIEQAFHLLNNFDLPIGAVRVKEGGKEIFDYTQWTSAIDLKKKRFYFHTYQNRAIKMVDLMKFDFEQDSVEVISMSGGNQIEELNARAQKMP